MLPTELITIDRYPKLRAWYDSNQSETQIDYSSVNFDLSNMEHLIVLQLCTAIEGPSHQLISNWCRYVEPFFSLQTSNVQGFEYLGQILSRFSLDLSEFYGDLAYFASVLDQGEEFTRHCMNLRNSGVVGPIDFIAAWSALNSGHPQTCIAICTDTLAMNASIYTIQGQALLETGAAHDATEILQIAVKLDPQEILAWFQLAKAYSVLDQPLETWNVLKKCRTLAPNNTEIGLFMAIEAQRYPKFLREATSVLVQLEPNFAGDSNLYLTLLKLLTMSKDRARFNHYLAKSNFDFTQPPKELAPLLRSMHQSGWYDEAVALLDRIIPAAS